MDCVGGEKMSIAFDFHKTEIEGLLEIQPFVFDDSRGSFIKDYSKEIFEQSDVTYDLEEVFYTESYAGVVRALHFQRNKQQPKLVRCISGSIYDVVVDLRRDSQTFKKWKSFRLSGENRREILIPAGCAHGYLVLKDSIVSYKCAEKFYGEYDDGIFWKDKDININWPLEELREEIIISEKDKALQSFAEFESRYKSL